MWDFSIGRTIRLVVQTMPLIVLRILVYFGITLCYIVAVAIGAGIGWAIGAVGSDEFRAGATFVGGLIGFGLVGIGVYLAREYILYLVKGGHIAVLVELMDGRPLPEGRSQIGYAQGIVRERFGETSVLFAVDQIVNAVLRAIIGLVRGILSILPIPALRQAGNIAYAFLRIGIGLVDEVILAYGIRTRSANPWQSARTALVLYGQNYRTMLKSAAWLTLFTYGLALIVFLIVLTPAAAIAWLFPGVLSGAGVMVALILAWAVKASIIEPFAMTAMMQVYFQTIEGQTPDPAWEEKLDGLSRKFGELGKRAAAWAPKPTQQQANPAPRPA